MEKLTTQEQTPQDILTQAHQAILRGDFKSAQEIVSTLINKKGLSIQQKLKLSHELQWLGMPVQAMKVLGKIAAPADFHLLSPEEFCLQVRAIYMLNFLGATYVARRLLEKTTDHLDQNNIDLSGYHFSLETYKAFIFYESARYHEALALFEKIVSKSKEPATKIYLELHLVACLEACGQSDKAKDLALKNISVLKPENDALKAMFLQNLARIYILEGDLVKGQNYIDEAAAIFGMEKRNKDQAYVFIWQGVIKGKNGEKEESKRLLDIAWDVLHHPLSQPQSQLTVLYWMEKNETKLDIASKIAIRAHSCIHSFSYLLGKPINNSPYPLHARIQKDASFIENHDCWFITKDEVIPMSYTELDLNSLDQAFDLYSGVEKKDKQRETFTEIQVRAIIAAIGAGPIGIHEFALIDFIYRQDFWDWQSGKERLKKLVQYLRKKGVPLTVQNQIHQINIFDLNIFPIILPMALDFKGHHHFVRAHRKSFTRQDLEEILGTKKTNASLLLKEWSKLGLLEEFSKDGIKVIYRFVK